MRTKELGRKTQHLEESNIALKVLLRQREKDKINIEDIVLNNIEKLVLPYLEKIKIKMDGFDEYAYIEAIESNLKEITRSFNNNFSNELSKLTPAEIQIVDLIKKNKTTKEIARLLKLSPTTIATHRQNIRKKLNLTNKKANLRTFLLINQK
jgi:DNA-binding CsgD family transcriptional regulator